MPETTGIISHAIVVPRDVADTVVAALSLAEKGDKTKQVCTGSSGGGGAFVTPCHRRSVVTQGMRGFTSNDGMFLQESLVEDGTGQLQVGVCDRASWMVIGDKIRLDGL